MIWSEEQQDECAMSGALIPDRRPGIVQERLCRPQAFKGRRGEAALWAAGPKKKGMTIGHALLFGGGEEIRTLAPAKPTYRISNHATNP